MKSFVVFIVSVSCLFVSIKAAAVETVVELQKDNSQLPNPANESKFSTNQDCIQPKETGRCYALSYRFAYDVEKRECVEFIYGGCGGNSNNFETKEDCEVKCLENKNISSGNDDDILSTTVSPSSETEATTVQALSA